MPEPTLFRAWLKRRRLERGLTQEDLGELVGYAAQTIRKIEGGQRRPSPHLALRLAQALQLAPEEHSVWMRAACGDASPESSAVATEAPPEAAQLSAHLADPAGWFARTKLHPPRRRADTLDRPRLLRGALRVIGDTRLILLSAPAGAGKTTLLTFLIERLHQGDGQPPRLAWISIDHDDNDLARLLNVLVDAWQTLAPAASEQARALLRGAQSDRAQLGRQVVTVLVNGLLESSSTRNLLVLDDLHLLVDPDVTATLAYLVERIPPVLTIAVATREDPPLPLARLRARRELVELRFAELRFTEDEVAALLNSTLGLRLTSDELATLYQHTEGWAASLAMLAASLLQLEEHNTRGRLLNHLARADRHLFEYLAGEVIEGQDPFVRAFLLETSVLPELTPQACAAVTGRADAAAILDQLYRRNLFLVEVADGDAASDEPGRPRSTTYRYHDLFRTVLLHRLTSEAPAWFQMLHRRAASAEPLPARRIAHYLQAEAWDAAAQEIVAVGGEAIDRGAFELVWGWIEQLPGATRAAFPRLALWRGVVLWHRLAADETRAELLAALHGFEAAGDAAGQEEALAWLALTQGEVGPVDLPLEAHLALRLRLASALGLLLTDRWEAANTLLDGLLAEAETRGEPWWIRTIAAELQLLFALVPGGVGRFERLLACVEGLPEAERRADLALRLRTTIAVWRGRQAEARELCTDLEALLEHDGQIAWSSLNMRGILTVALGMHGGHEADQTLDEVLVYLERQRGSFARGVRVSFLSLAVRSALLRGELEAARQLAARIGALSRDSSFAYVRALNLILEGRVALTEGRLTDAATAFGEAIPLQQRTRFTVLYGDAPLLLATVAVLQGRQSEALALLAPCLQFYAEEDLPGLLLWQSAAVVPALRLAEEQGVAAPLVRKVLRLLDERAGEPGQGRVAPPASGEFLSPREVEVLRLLVEGVSNTEIAERLMISPHTAKHHVSNVLAKLGVTSRTAAVRAARDLGFV